MSLINTRTQEFRVNSGLDKWETRPSQWGCYDSFVKDTKNGLLSPQLIKTARESIGSDVKIPVIDYDGTISIGTARSATVADKENTSQLYTVTWNTLWFGFTQAVTMFKNNEIGAQRDFDTKLRKHIIKLGYELDILGEAALSAAKTQVFADDLGYDTTGNVLISSTALQDNFIGDMDVVQNANDYFDRQSLIGNYKFKSMIKKMSEHGLYNDKNQTIQYDDKDLSWSKNIANGVGHKATGYIYNRGSLGFMTRFDREALAGIKSGHKNYEFGLGSLPGIELPVGTMYYEEVGDLSAIGGAATADMKAALKRHFAWGVDVAFITPYNSDQAVIASPIIKVAITTA